MFNAFHCLKVERQSYVVDSPDVVHPLTNSILPEDTAEVLKGSRKSAPSENRINKSILINIPPAVIELQAKIFIKCIQLAYFPREWK